MTTVSGDFICDLRALYWLALQGKAGGCVLVHARNSYSGHAPAAYVIAVAAVEAFVNELAFCPLTRMQLRDAPIWQLDRDWLEKVDIRQKVVLVAHLLFGGELRRDQQPFQDFDLLVRVRNDFVHYKMDRAEPKYVRALRDRGIALPETGIWVHEMSSSEGIRWAHNTACALAHAVVDLADEDRRPALSRFVEYFQPLNPGSA